MRPRKKSHAKMISMLKKECKIGTLIVINTLRILKFMLTFLVSTFHVFLQERETLIEPSDALNFQDLKPKDFTFNGIVPSR